MSELTTYELMRDQWICAWLEVDPIWWVNCADRISCRNGKITTDWNNVLLHRGAYMSALYILCQRHQSHYTGKCSDFVEL